MDDGNGHGRVLVDSNIFLRVFVRDDVQKWKDSTNVMHAIAQNHLSAYIPSLVPAEVNFVLTSFYRFEKHRIIEATKAIVSISNLKVIDDLSVALATQIYEEHSVKFSDCLLASSELIQSGEAAILSYDRDFDKLGVRRVEPGELLKKLQRKK